MHKKGFIFTVDALLSMFMLTIMLIVSAPFLTKKTYAGDYVDVAQSLGTVLEKDGTFERADYVEIRKKLNQLTGPYCSMVEIQYYGNYSENLREITMIEPFCEGSSEYSSILRTFITHEGYGLAKISVWKEKPKGET